MAERACDDERSVAMIHVTIRDGAVMQLLGDVGITSRKLRDEEELAVHLRLPRCRRAPSLLRLRALIGGRRHPLSVAATRCPHAVGWVRKRVSICQLLSLSGKRVSFKRSSSSIFVLTIFVV